MRKEQYEKAEECLNYFPREDPERKRRQVRLCHAAGRTAEEMLSGLEGNGGFRHSRLYEHMEFAETRAEFVKEMKDNLRKCFQDEESFGFLRDDKTWQELWKTL